MKMSAAAVEVAESASAAKLNMLPRLVECSFSSSSGSSSVEGSLPSDCSTKTSPGASPAHQLRSRPKCLAGNSSLPPKSSCPKTTKHRLSLGKPVSMKEIRSCSVGHEAPKEVKNEEEALVVKRRNSKSGSLGHVRSSSLSNGRDRHSLYAPSPSVSEESSSERSRDDCCIVSDIMTHSLTNNNDRLIRNRKPLVQKSAEKKARKIKFYRNGDRFFKGVTLAVSSERYRTFDALLSELNRLVGDRVNLHQGVRVLFGLDGTKISTVDELQDGECYVCASSDTFKKMDYSKCTDPRPQRTCRITSGQGATICREAPMISGLDHWKERRRKNQANNNLIGTGGGAATGAAHADPASSSVLGPRWSEYMKPRLITIIRNGSRPRKAVRLLLNKKTAHSYEQVLTDITEAIRPDSGVVRKIFTMDGRQVLSLADFFGQDFIFIAYGNEKFSQDDFDLTSNEVKFLPAFISRSPMNPRRGRGLPHPAHQHHHPQGSIRSGSQGRTSDIMPVSRDRSMPGSYEEPEPSSNQLVVDVPIVVEVRFEVGRIIGDGNFAVVRQGVDRRNGGRFALKLIDKRRCQGKEVVLESEVHVLSRLRHPNVVKLYDVIDAGSTLCLVLELVEGGDLFDAIAAAGKFSEAEARRMTLDLASALSYLHSLNIVHRDVKPENLFVVNLADGMRSLKLGDFGLAQEVNEMLFTVCGTPTYVAPEILLETGYGLKVDIWATGVILFILLCGYPPFVSPTNDQEELFDSILAGTFDFAPPYWDQVSSSAKDLITLMLHTDPELRFSANEILQHPWVTDDEEWPDLQQCRKFGLHFDTHVTESSLQQASSSKPNKSLVSAESTPCLHSLKVL